MRSLMFGALLSGALALSACAPATAAVISGDSGDNTLRGTPGHDLMSGRQGDDRMRGLAGRDSLFGGVGDDRLIGAGQTDFGVGGRRP
jgi:Ca2+-binding RTX toxin-like protein